MGELNEDGEYQHPLQIKGAQKSLFDAQHFPATGGLGPMVINLSPQRVITNT